MMNTHPWTDNTSKVDEVYGAERYNKANALYGFDKDGNVVNIDQKDERDFSIYAYEAGSARPVYEFVGGDFNEIRYSRRIRPSGSAKTPSCTTWTRTATVTPW